MLQRLRTKAQKAALLTYSNNHCDTRGLEFISTDLRVLLGESLHSEDSRDTVLYLTCLIRMAYLLGKNIRKFLRTGIGFYPQGQTIRHVEGAQKYL